MACIVLIFIALVVWKNEKVFSKLKLFFKKCKWLMVLELIIVIALATVNILDSSVIIKEKDPHTNGILKQDTLKEGQIYTYYTVHYERNEEENDFSNIMQNLKENPNEIKIEAVGITKVKVWVNSVEKEYKYGHGFSYYSMTSCVCGTPIIFEKTLTGVIKIMILAMIIIDLFIIVFIKSKNTDN